MKKIPKKNPDIIWKNVRGETVLLNPTSGKYYGLNKVGCAFWEKVDGKKAMPEIADLLLAEFTVERGKLYILQTRNGKMNAQAIVRTSMDMVDEKLISREKAVSRLKPQELEQLLHKRIDPKFRAKPIATGLPASPGAASGKAFE